MTAEEQLLQIIRDSDRKPDTIRNAWRRFHDRGHAIDPVKYAASIAKRTGSKWRGWKIALLHYRIAKDDAKATFSLNWKVSIRARDYTFEGSTRSDNPRMALRNILFRNVKDKRQTAYARINYAHLSQDLEKYVTPLLDSPDQGNLSDSMLENYR